MQCSKCRSEKKFHVSKLFSKLEKKKKKDSLRQKGLSFL